MPRPTRLFIATSLDGYIAAPHDDLSFLSIVEQEGEDYGYADFISGVDTVVLGRKSYDYVSKMVSGNWYGDKNVFVITRTPRPASDNISFHTGDLPALITDLKAQDGKNIFIDGGAEVVAELMKHDLIDEYTISIIPIFLGGGVRLFPDGRPEQRLELVGVKHFPKGLVQLHYKRAMR